MATSLLFKGTVPLGPHCLIFESDCIICLFRHINVPDQRSGLNQGR